MSGNMESGSNPSAVFFGLSTAVELFKDPRSAQAVTRAKEAALLYDRVIFEIGMLDVTVGEGGSSSFWIPPDGITDERRARARIPTEVGSPFSLSFGKQEAFGVPVHEEDMVTMISTNVTHAYVAEFHTGILDETHPLELDWVEVAELPTTFSADDDLGKAIRAADFQDWTDKQLMPDRQKFERDLIYKSFNRDVTVANAIGATISVTPLFNPMIQHRGLPLERSGDKALNILVPNLSALSWEAVDDFRSHPGCSEARAMLRMFESNVAELEPDDDVAQIQTLAAEITGVYQQALNDSRTRLGRELADEALKTSVAMVPGVGPIAEKAATVTQIAREWNRERRSWTAAIFELNRRQP